MSDQPSYEDMEIEYGLDKHFRWWLQARESRIEAAAEQRGAVKSLRNAAKVLHDDVDIIIKGNYAVYFREDESDRGKGIFPWRWLDNRADQIEGAQDD